MTDAAARSNLLCLVFTDLVDSTALKSRLGDSAARDLMSNYHGEVLGLAGEFEGHEIDSVGEFIRENLDWLDRSLGPVARR